jgi:hypothetical protein
MYRALHFDGGNGWCLGDVVDVEPVEGEEGVYRLDGQEFSSRNDDGLLEDADEGMTLLVPLG